MQTLEIEGATIAYADTGEPPGGGPTLMLVHGFPLSHAVWQSQIDALRATCRVIAPDLRGYGESSRGPWPTADEAPSLDRFADDLAMLLDATRPRGPIALVGFSMGGYIGFSFLRRHADRLAGLALVDTRAVADDEAARAKRLKMAEKVSEWGSARVAEMMRPALFGAGAPQEAIDQTVRVIASTHPETIAASQRAMAARPDSTPLLAGITIPTLVLVGEHDAISTAEEMRGVADRIPGCRYVELTGAGHMTPVEAPEAVGDRLRDFAQSLC